MKNEKKSIFIVLILTQLSFILFSCENKFMQTLLPEPLSGSAAIIGECKIGQTLVLDTRGIKGNSGTLAYKWLADGTAIPGAAGISYIIMGIDAGKIISCIISGKASQGRILTLGKIVPYTLVIEMLDWTSGDSVTAIPDTGNIGDEIILNYSVADAAIYNYLMFSGTDATIGWVNKSGDGMQTYCVNPEDARDGIIKITAAFERANFKFPGATVTQPTVIGIPAPNSITIGNVILTDNSGNQIVEYAISQANNIPSENLVWQTNSSFTGLSPATIYYAYARSAENTNFHAGDYSVSSPIRFYTVSFHANEATSGSVPPMQSAFQNEFIVLPARGSLTKTNFAFACWNTQPGGNGSNFIFGQPYQVTGNQILYAKWVAEQIHVFPFLPPESNMPIVSGITISQTGTGNYPATGILEISNPDDYFFIEWFYGSVKLGEGASLELDATDIRYNIAGTHNITVVAWQGEGPQSIAVSFEVIE